RGRVAADVALTERGQFQRRHFPQHIAQVQVRLGDGLDVLAAHIAQIALFASDHIYLLCPFLPSQTFLCPVPVLPVASLWTPFLQPEPICCQGDFLVRRLLAGFCGASARQYAWWNEEFLLPESLNPASASLFVRRHG